MQNDFGWSGKGTADPLNHPGFTYQNPRFAPGVQTVIANQFEDLNAGTFKSMFEDKRMHQGERGREKTLPLATIFVRPQAYKGVSSREQALAQGTAFPELVRPFTGNIGGIIHD